MKTPDYSNLNKEQLLANKALQKRLRECADASTTPDENLSKYLAILMAGAQTDLLGEATLWLSDLDSNGDIFAEVFYSEYTFIGSRKKLSALLDDYLNGELVPNMDKKEKESFRRLAEMLRRYADLITAKTDPTDKA